VTLRVRILSVVVPVLLCGTLPALAANPVHVSRTEDTAPSVLSRATEIGERSLKTATDIPIGIASYYASKFHGRCTASGAVYNENAMTAAHPTLPFGTRVKVTDMRNLRTVVVKITDRGPFVRGRIIDLSRSAASHLGILARGTAQVRLEPIEP
jgi:rare lipoprotein A